MVDGSPRDVLFLVDFVEHKPKPRGQATKDKRALAAGAGFTNPDGKKHKFDLRRLQGFVLPNEFGPLVLGFQFQGWCPYTQWQPFTLASQAAYLEGISLYGCTLPEGVADLATAPCAGDAWSPLSLGGSAAPHPPSPWTCCGIVRVACDINVHAMTHCVVPLNHEPTKCTADTAPAGWLFSPQD